MDAQGRRDAGDVDPADQWVFNPDTGSYELRLNPAAEGPQGPQTPSSEHRTAPHPRRETSPRSSRRHPESTEQSVPAQRGGRRAQRGAASATGAGHSRRKPKPKPSAKKRVLRWGGGTMGLLLIAGCTGAYWWMDRLNDNIDKVDVGEENPAVTDGPVNILLIGTDSRTGKGNKGYGDTGSVGHADTTLLFHVSEDRSNATVLSIPRDLITDIPDCKVKQEDGSSKIIPGEQNVRFNTSLGQRGRDPGCTWHTVEQLTGVEIQHFMMADFNAVKTLSSAIDGVEVCVAKDIDDPKSHLKLSAGRHTIEGEQALAFVRTRQSVGFKSDLDRIKLQQQFLGSMIRKMKSSDTLTDPGKLWDLSEAATTALTVDTGIGTVKKLIDLAKDLRRVDTDNVTFLTTPVLDNPENSNTVILNEAKATPVFKMIQQDKSLTETEKNKKNKKGKKDKKQVEKAPASEVRVDVLNGGGPIGAAQSTVTWLQNTEGVPLSTNAGNAAEKVGKTQLSYAPNQAGQAATLAEMMGLPDSALKKSSGEAGPEEPMTLTLGPDFTAAGEPIAAPDKAPDVPQMNAADKSVCAG
ncbi:LCP family protein [Streptomyces sp. JJ36]|uniref:LCP family protein n=1 Tax=Streptomyces sp. JJ36 TaxID=2736645 RepID=UPI001F1CD44D|nr:LCP family protein [Streptomyces sp. JJ36]MCF6524018.1 LCP family protein [Streptomyces sp. JJ36]